MLLTMLPHKVVNEYDRGWYVYFPLRGKMVILHPRELLLAYQDISELSVLWCTDHNINNLFVDSLSK